MMTMGTMRMRKKTMNTYHAEDDDEDDDDEIMMMIGRMTRRTMKMRTMI